jgi:hypothetical protein
MTSTPLTYPLRAAWRQNPLFRGAGAVLGICLIALVTIVVLGFSSEELLTFLLGSASFGDLVVLDGLRIDVQPFSIHRQRR